MRRVQLGGVFIRVMFHGFVRVLDGMHGVAVRNVRMVTCLDVIAAIVVASGFPMVFGCILVVFGGFEVVLNAFVFRHVVSPHFGVIWEPVVMLLARRYGPVRNL